MVWWVGGVGISRESGLGGKEGEGHGEVGRDTGTHHGCEIIVWQGTARSCLIKEGS